ncbi:MAG: PGPGW domain-containing protein [Bradymonadia bacterium]
MNSLAAHAVEALCIDVKGEAVEWLTQGGLWLVGLSVGTFVLALVALPWLLVRLPADYLIRAPAAEERAPALQRLALNIFGGLLVIAGMAMLVLPGQGVLTLIAGLMLMDFPGKRTLLVKLINRPSALKGINALRRRAGAPNLTPPPLADGPR